MPKFYVVGVYGPQNFSLLTTEGKTLAECKRSIDWQNNPRPCGTPFHICKATETRGVFADINSNARFEVERGALTETAFKRLMSEIWPMTTIEYMRADRPETGHASEWHFFRSYVGTALWSTNDESDESGGEPLDANYDVSDIAPETLESMLQDCASFYAANSEHIHCDGAPLSHEFDGPTGAREAAMAGHDFWLNRCGHGAGFWDGDWPEPAASVLDGAAKAFGNVDLYVGDDGQIYA